jgi:signal transduction histidine kinase
VETEDGLLVISSIVDISERKQAEIERRKLEEQLRQAQKMEAIGQLASGIAHEFNNIMQAILGTAELAKDNIFEDSRDEDLNEIIANVNRGKAIVEQILMFTHDQKLTLKPLDLKKRINDACRLLNLTLPDEVDLHIFAEPGLHQIMADATSIDQILINLVNNAIHSMPNGGELDIALEPFYAHDNFVRINPELNEGWYIRMMVRDTGEGMEEMVRKKAFDPFFTTKEPGKGTGLGLSVVHGLVRDHGGTVWINSEPGSGTTVNCLFPVVEEEELSYLGDEISVPYGNSQRNIVQPGVSTGNFYRPP